jgi:hypothetical protein
MGMVGIVGAFQTSYTVPLVKMSGKRPQVQVVQVYFYVPIIISDG